MADLQTRYDITGKWAWDGHLVGMGNSQPEDRALVLMQGIVLPTRVNLVFPSEDARNHASEDLKRNWNGIPVADFTRIELHMKLQETHEYALTE